MKKTKKEKVKIQLRWIIIILVFVIAFIAGTKVLDKEKSNNTVQNNNVENLTQNDEEQNIEKYVQILENGTKLNISEKLNQNREFENLEIQDIQLTYSDGVTNLLANVVNNGSNTFENTKVEITLLDEDENTIYTLKGIIEKTEAGETNKLNTSITADFANAYDFKIEKVK